MWTQLVPCSSRLLWTREKCNVGNLESLQLIQVVCHYKGGKGSRRVVVSDDVWHMTVVSWCAFARWSSGEIMMWRLKGHRADLSPAPQYTKAVISTLTEQRLLNSGWVFEQKSIVHHRVELVWLNARYFKGRSETVKQPVAVAFKKKTFHSKYFKVILCVTNSSQLDVSLYLCVCKYTVEKLDQILCVLTVSGFLISAKVPIIHVD